MHTYWTDADTHSVQPIPTINKDDKKNEQKMEGGKSPPFKFFYFLFLFKI